MHTKRRKWQQVDNVANTFLATYNNRDPRVMRVCCTLNEEIDPRILQEALNETVRIRPQFQVRIHRGFFWRYIEESSDVPKVRKEKGRVCPNLYYQDRPEKPLYKVSYFGRRINIDIFHAIADGTGAMEFLNVLVVEYLRRVHPHKIGDIYLYKEQASRNLTENSFKTNYKKELVKELKKEKGALILPDGMKRAYHYPSRKLPYEQLQFFEIHVPLDVVKSRAKNFGVGMTSYLGAALIMSFAQSMTLFGRKKPVTISMPVNLRNYYDSDTVRNFFNNVSISHICDGRETLKNLSAEYQEQLLDALKEENVKKQMSYLQDFQTQWVIRAVPLIIKEPGLLFFVKQNEKRVSAVLSNLGTVKMPDEISGYIDHYCGYCSSENPFIVLSSFKNTLTMGVSYPYADPTLMRNFVGILTEKGIPVKLYATEVVR